MLFAILDVLSKCSQVLNATFLIWVFMDYLIGYVNILKNVPYSRPVFIFFLLRFVDWNTQFFLSINMTSYTLYYHTFWGETSSFADDFPLLVLKK